MIIDIPGSPGELIDKITILELKVRHFADPARRGSVAQQLARLQALWDERVAARAGAAEIASSRGEQREVNAMVWYIDEEKSEAVEAKK
jgi:hypothetical protein